MQATKHVTILSGGGSPHGDEYRPVYELIHQEAKCRGVSDQLVDYVGIGHFPDLGVGLNLPRAIDKSFRDIESLLRPNGSTLFCRSFGSYVGVSLLSKYPRKLSAFSRIVLWGPPPYHFFWRLLARDPDSLERYNKKAISKGALLSSDSWQTMVPLEQMITTLSRIDVVIGHGTEDEYCDSAFAQYLANLLWKHTSCSVRVIEISGASHEIRPEPAPGISPSLHASIKKQYFDMIFGSPIDELQRDEQPS